MINFKRKAWLSAILLTALLCTIGILTSCSDDNKGNTETNGADTTTQVTITTQDPTTDGELVGVTAPDGELTLYWIQWTGSGIPREDKSGYCCWDYLAAEQKHVNKLNIHFLCKDEKGNYMKGIPDPESLKEQLTLMQYEFEQSEIRGIDIVGYGDTVQCDINTATKMGYTLEQLGVKDVNGNYIYVTMWNDGCYLACINSPQWREWQREDLKLMAEAGFSEFQFDLHPFALSMVYCRCDNCKNSWAEYSKRVLGEEKDIPRGYLDFSTAESREFYKWKVLCLKEFKEEIEIDAKKINPDFKICMNDNVNGYNFGFECLYDVWDGVTTEFGGTSNGYGSTLYMYQLAEAFGYDSLRAQYCYDSEVDPLFRLQVNYGEAFGTIGGISYVVRPVGDQMFNFADKYSDLFIETKSLAKAAVLYSVESNFFSLKPNEIDHYNQLYSFATDRARQVAYSLVKSGICYDYLVVEEESALEDLAKYELLVLPDYTYFDSEVWKPILEKAAANGTKIVVIGTTPRETIEGYGITGNFKYIPSFASVGDELDFFPGLIFKNAVKGTEASELVKLNNNLANTAITIRSNAENLTYLHIIRRGGEENCDEHYQELEYKLPEGKRVIEVTALSPFNDTVKSEVDLDWSVEDGVLKAKTGDFEIYCILRIVTQ